MLSENQVSFFVSFCLQSCNEFPTMKYVWMTEYQASNIAVEDTENSTLIERWVLDPMAASQIRQFSPYLI